MTAAYNESLSSAPVASLGVRSLSALKWNYLGTAIKLAAQFLIGVLLARLLGPEPFGLVAIAWLLLGLGNLVADFGLTSALVQKPQLSEQDIRYVFTWQMLTGVGLSLLLALTATQVASFFGRPDAALVLQVMGITFTIQAAGQTATSLLKRRLDFRMMQIIQVASYLAGYLLVGVPLAYSGAGVWALVVAQLVQSSVYSTLIYLPVRHSLRPALKPEQAGLFGFGSKVMLSNLTSWGFSNLDSAIIGRMLGVLDLGLYNRSMNLLATPMNAVVAALQGILFPYYSRTQGQNDTHRQTYLASLAIMALIMLPPFCAVAAIPVTTIEAIYGHKWLATAVVITPLALAMPVYAILALGGPLMLGQGRAGMEAGVQGLNLILMIGATVLAAQYSLAAVAWAVLGVYVLRAVLVTRLASGLVEAGAGAVLRALAGPALLSIFAAMLISATDLTLSHYIHAALPRFALDMAVVCSGLVAMCIAFGRYLFSSEALLLMLRVQPGLPSPVGKQILRWVKP